MKMDEIIKVEMTKAKFENMISTEGGGENESVSYITLNLENETTTNVPQTMTFNYIDNIIDFTDIIYISFSIEDDSVKIKTKKTNNYEYEGIVAYVYQGSFVSESGVLVFNCLFSPQKDNTTYVYIMFGNLAN